MLSTCSWQKRLAFGEPSPIRLPSAIIRYLLLSPRVKRQEEEKKALSESPLDDQGSILIKANTFCRMQEM